jgi:hypothetical protein
VGGDSVRLRDLVRRCGSKTHAFEESIGVVGMRFGLGFDAHRPAQLLEDFINLLDQHGALLDEVMASLESAEWIDPGIAKTSRPCSAAKRAVMSEPLGLPASTTSTPRAGH